MKKLLSKRNLLFIITFMLGIICLMYFFAENYSAAIFSAISLFCYFAYYVESQKINSLYEINETILRDNRKLNHMLEPEDISDHIKKNGFGLTFMGTMKFDGIYGTDYVSNGILYALNDIIFVSQAADACKRFLANDFGDYYNDKPELLAQDQCNSYEFGSYPSKFGKILIHRNNSKTTMCFPCEE